MSDLNERLDRAFSAIEPGPAPVEAAMEHGTKIRSRRRAAALVGSVAVIAAVVAGVPVLTHPQARPGPSASRIRVTVNPPGPHAPAGTIASGLIGTRPWNVRIESPGKDQCVTGLSLALYCDAPRADAASPVSFEGTANEIVPNGYFVSYGAVRRDVASARVVLANGTVLTLHPTTVYGTRWVAFANPLSVPVTRLTAYSRSGEIATAIPFNGVGGHGEPVVGTWQRPGQASPPRVTTTLASGTLAGQAWELAVYAGPWGLCVAGGDGSDCLPAAPAPLSEGIALQGGPGVGTSGTLAWGIAADSVSYLIVTPKGGTAMRVDVTRVGQQKYFGLALRHAPEKADRWTAYDSAGQPIDSGTLSFGGA